jgi:hypothetical protein
MENSVEPQKLTATIIPTGNTKNSVKTTISGEAKSQPARSFLLAGKTGLGDIFKPLKT